MTLLGVKTGCSFDTELEGIFFVGSALSVLKSWRLVRKEASCLLAAAADSRSAVQSLKQAARMWMEKNDKKKQRYALKNISKF